MRIQGCHFLKSALNLDLTLSDDGKCPALLESSGIIDLGAFCVELWPKQVSYRISVPMSYISCSRLIISMFHKSQKCKLFENHSRESKDVGFLKVLKILF